MSHLLCCGIPRGKKADKQKKSPKVKDELKLAFSLFDKDRDGFISKGELSHVMRALGVQVNDAMLTRMFKQVDLDGNGLIDYEEFVRLMESRTESQSEDAEMRAYFAAFDKDHNGYIDALELKTTFNDLGMKVTDRDVKEMMKEVGVEIQGRIYYEDFVKMMTGKIGRAQKRVSSRVNSDCALPQIPVEDEEEEDVETRELRVAFAMFDKDGDGAITSSELLQVMKSLKMDTSTSHVKHMIRKVDLDGNGTIEFGELVRMMKKRRQLAMICRKDKRQDEEEMRQAFRVFDKDSTGYIDANDLRVTMREMGMELTSGDVRAMMHEAGVKTDGRIYYEDFVRIMFGQIIKPSPHNKIGEMNTDQLQELKVAFALFDKDADGCITTSELRTVMRTLGFDTSDREVAKMIDRFDDDGNGTIEFDEFVQMMSSKNRTGVSRWDRSSKRDEPESWRAFKMFDRDRNGYISAVELKMAMKELGVVLSDSDVQAMIREADIDGDGKINYQEFVNMMEGKFQSGAKEEDKRMRVQPSPTTSAHASPAKSKPQSSSHAKSSTPITPQKVSRTHAAPPPPPPPRPSPTAKQTKSSPRSSPRPNGTPSSRPQPHNAQPAQQVVPAQKVPSSRTSDDITVTEFRDVFKMFDTNNDGYIQASELGNVMRMLGLPYTPEKLQAMIQNVSTTGNGTVDFQEFLQMMSRSRSKHKSEETRKMVEEDEMRQAFKVFDIDGNGYIDAHELRLTMQNLGESLTEEDVRAMIREADTNGDGKIDYEEFIKMMYAK